MGLIAIRQNRQFRVIFFIVITVLKMHVNAMIEKLINTWHACIMTYKRDCLIVIGLTTRDHYYS